MDPVRGPGNPLICGKVMGWKWSIRYNYRMSLKFDLTLERLRKQGFAGIAAIVGGLMKRVTCVDYGIWMIIGNENDQVWKGQLVDALACTGDEGRDTLR